MIRSVMSFLWIVIYAASLVQAFAPSTIIQSNRGVSFLSQSNIPEDDGSNRSDDAEPDDPLLNELRDTKKDMFGTDIPINDELKEAAQNAENAFLAAMLEQTQQFQQIKSEEGSERACDVFMGKIQEEDERARGEVVSESDGGDTDDDAIEKKWFVQQIQNDDDDDEDSIERVEGIYMDDDDNAWQ